MMPNEQYARGISLFKTIPVNRTCDSAGIPYQYCSCLEWKPLLHTDPLVQKASEKLIMEIQHILKPYSHMCESIALKTVDTATAAYFPKDEIKLSNEFKPKINVTLLQISITTTPGDGKFEAVLEIRNTRVALASSIDRINQQSKSDCATDFLLENYCVCRK